MDEWVKKDAQFLADICAFEEPQALVAKPDVPQVQFLRLTPAEYQRAHEVGCACTFSHAYFIFTYIIYIGALPTWLQGFYG